MCLIVYKPKGVPYNLAAKQGIIAAYNQNSTGWGWMHQKENSKHIDFKKYSNKGVYNAITDILEDIEEQKIGINDYFAFHGRTGTSGCRMSYNSHPYLIDFELHKLTDKERYMFNQGPTQQPLLMHNGIFHGYEILSEEFSDSYNVANTIFNVSYDELTSKEFIENHAQYTQHDKVLIFYPEKEPILYGDFKLDIHSGLIFSHNGYKYVKYKDVGGINLTENLDNDSNVKDENDDVVIFEKFKLSEIKLNIIDEYKKNNSKQITNQGVSHTPLRSCVSSSFSHNTRSKETYSSLNTLTNLPLTINKHNVEELAFVVDVKNGFKWNDITYPVNCVIAFKTEAFIKLSQEEVNMLHYNCRVVLREKHILADDEIKIKYEGYLILLEHFPYLSKNKENYLNKIISKMFKKKDHEFIRIKNMEQKMIEVPKCSLLEFKKQILDNKDIVSDLLSLGRKRSKNYELSYE